MPEPHQDNLSVGGCDEVLVKIEGEDGELITVTSLHVGNTEKPQGRSIYLYIQRVFEPTCANALMCRFPSVCLSVCYYTKSHWIIIH